MEADIVTDEIGFRQSLSHLDRMVAFLKPALLLSGPLVSLNLSVMKLLSLIRAAPRLTSPVNSGHFRFMPPPVIQRIF